MNFERSSAASLGNRGYQAPCQRANLAGASCHKCELPQTLREQRWKTPSASLIEKNPEVIPDMDIAVKLGQNFFLDEKILRHE